MCAYFPANSALRNPVNTCFPPQVKFVVAGDLKSGFRLTEAELAPALPSEQLQVETIYAELPILIDPSSEEWNALHP